MEKEKYQNSLKTENYLVLFDMLSAFLGGVIPQHPGWDSVSQ